MPGDMRDELIRDGAVALAERCPNGFAHHQGLHKAEARDVIDSIPPGSFKNEKGEWVRLEVAVCNCDEEAYRRGKYHSDDCPWSREPKYVYTEVDHAE